MTSLTPILAAVAAHIGTYADTVTASSATRRPTDYANRVRFTNHPPEHLSGAEDELDPPPVWSSKTVVQLTYSP